MKNGFKSRSTIIKNNEELLITVKDKVMRKFKNFFNLNMSNLIEIGRK